MRISARSSAIRTTAITASIGVALAALAACSSSDASDGEAGDPIRIVVNPAAPPSMPLVADHIGSFEDEGLEVEVEVQPTTAITTFAPGLGRQYDIAWGTPADVIAAKAQGHDLTVIAAAYVDTEENSMGQLFAAKDGGVTSLADLDGKRIATPSLSGTLYLSLLTALGAQGLSPDDVTLVEVPFPNMLDQLNAGRVDAIATVQPFSGGFVAAGHTPLGDPFLAVDSPATPGMWIADRAWAEKNQEIVDQFIAGIDAADEWVASHDEEARAFLAEALQLPPEIMAKAPLPTWETDISAEDLQPWIDALDATGQVNGDLPTADQLVPGS